MAALACMQFLTFVLVITPVSLLRTGLYGETNFAVFTQAVQRHTDATLPFRRMSVLTREILRNCSMA